MAIPSVMVRASMAKLRRKGRGGDHDRQLRLLGVVHDIGKTARKTCTRRRARCCANPHERPRRGRWESGFRLSPTETERTYDVFADYVANPFKIHALPSLSP